jgi:aryl-alcohol dehydrogenase-like predicted oxidoreductase
MQYAMLGQSGLVVSRFAFGAMTFTAGSKDIGAIYKVEAGLADRLVGAALKARRAAVVIATKVGFRSAPGLVQAVLSRRRARRVGGAGFARLAHGQAGGDQHPAGRSRARPDRQ